MATKNAINSANPIEVAKGGTGLATIQDHTLMIGSGTAVVTVTAVGSNGMVLLGKDADDPSWALLASAGSTIAFTPGANTLNLETGGAVAVSFPADGGTATPAAGALTVAGGTNITTAGAASTITVNLDAAIAGTTSHDFAAGGRIGTATGAGNTLLLRAYDVDGTAYKTFATLTANNTPTCDLDTAVTINSKRIYRADDIISVTDGGTGVSDPADHSILVGSGAAAITLLATGTATQLLQSGGAGADPAWSTATFPATTAQGDLLYSSAANTIIALTKDATATRYLSNTGATNNPAWALVELTNGVNGVLPVINGGTGIASPTDHSVIVGSGAGAMTALAAAANGQLIIGSGGADPVVATLTDGTGINITEGAGTITIATTVSAMTWSEAAGATQGMAVENGYTTNNGAQLDYTLPAAATVGQRVAIAGNSANGWTLSQNAGQTVHFVSSDTTTGAGGSLTSTNQYDCVELICITENTDWVVRSSVGNITVV